MKRKLMAVTTAAVIGLQGSFMLAPQEASALSNRQSSDSYHLSPGVEYSKHQYHDGGSNRQAVNVLSVDLTDEFTRLDINLPGRLQTTTNQAKEKHKEGNQVVGATNAAFFNFSSGLPVNLIALNNVLVNRGIIGKDANSPTNTRVAFGVDKDGKGRVHSFQIGMNLDVNGKKMNISQVNGERSEGDTVLYTPAVSSTGTNPWGVEVVVDGIGKSVTSVPFGETVTGTVKKITYNGEGGNATVPRGGFVLSMHGKEAEKYIEGLKEGDDISFTNTINEPWLGAEYVMAAGPMLVDNGRPNITMNTGSSFAKGRHPRTAIGVDKSGENVFMVTIDGRQPGYSSGATLNELANYMISLGAHDAINLDGGGSTAMSIRDLGTFSPALINKPSDGAERGVSATLQAISTAPTGDPETIKFSKEAEGKIVKGTSLDLMFDYALDEYYNTVRVDDSDINYDVTGGVGDISGKTFTATNAGKGKIVARVGDATGEIDVTVVSDFDKLAVTPEALVFGKNASVQLTAQALENNGEELVFDPSTVKWEVEGDVGTIDDNGKFTSGNQAGQGHVIASVGDVTTKVPVQIASGPLPVSSLDSVNGWTASAARAKASISAEKDRKKEGQGSLQIDYDFTGDETGTKTAYAIAKDPLALKGQPRQLGAWVYGDGNTNWLRGVIVDGKGERHTIDFTERDKMNWTGWKYVTADVPKNAPLPLSFERIYIAQPDDKHQDKGTVYVDQLDAIYSDDFTEPVSISFSDLSTSHWAYSYIRDLAAQRVITGFPDGTFKPEASLTRAQAAIMLVRDQGITPGGSANFSDVASSHYAAEEIAAAVDAGLLNGRSETTFAPDAPLKRAELTALLQRAYNVGGEADTNFSDVPSSHWASAVISQLASADIVNGYPDGTFRPERATTRAEFSKLMGSVKN
ncbi:hypothetical protein G4V62_16700 [Bacillaceae bacterium SIJ1]|uniref:S-layer homology domain-containing protein n=1 Tax=Litoribacterium kuwaitense TaxID=1398745 RepID=UPI0013EA9BBC|nr:S-layer homology domain-containing protein [Litoribacterium kuwaitense]NGP46505.1 hypothetical protein [Litoribacterium kuwaitense]